jgi:uncharacterized protein YdiU (UPF0061 family)
VLVANQALAAELGVETPTAEVLLAPEGIAQVYSGHQFGTFSGRLGDGRALLLGELVDPHGRRRDVHLKGSGRTPFARGGDGKAVVGPMLREYVIGEAMHALGIPTSRALAVLTTGERVMRDGAPFPGAVLARVAASHIRVGTFEYAARHGDVRQLADYAIGRHYPEATGYLDFYTRVVDAQAALIARWMHVGFIHGVMNTDNMAISGESIDYGPCAFMDAYDPSTVYSSIDIGGRYAYGNQPAIAAWNLARFAETLLPILDEPDPVKAATEVLETFDERFTRYWLDGMHAKLGLSERDDALIGELMTILPGHDYTSAFRALTREDVPDWLAPWAEQWRERNPDTAAMDRVNPIYIPRNHLVEDALTAATGGDLEPFERLIEAITHPFDPRPGFEAYAEPAPTDFGPYRTFCGT